MIGQPGTVRLGRDPDSLSSFTCRADFDALASEPLDSSLPGHSRSKVVMDLADGNALYFQNSKKYKIHYEFASTHLSGQGRPLIPSLSEFNQTEYFSPAVASCWEPSPQRTRRVCAGACALRHRQLGADADAVHPGAQGQLLWPQLVFHPTSDTVAAEASRLPASIPQKSTG